MNIIKKTETLFILIVLLNVSVHAETLKLSLNAGPSWAFSFSNSTPVMGFVLPFTVEFEVMPHLRFISGIQYSYHPVNSDSVIKWYDPLVSQTNNMTLHVKNFYHTFILSTGIKYFFPVNWQSVNRRFLKYFMPYAGIQADFVFMDLYRSYNAGTTLPNFLKGLYNDKATLLTPTIGATVCVGTLIHIDKSQDLNLIFQYTAFIPEIKSKENYINHFLQICLGYELKLWLYSGPQSLPADQNKY